jgi:dolichol-phosphate mannosyltransferase
VRAGDHVLIVVLPAYNEAPNLVPLLDRIAASLQGIEHRVLVVDDGSVDDTAAIAERRASSGVVLQKNPRNLGLAETIKRGMVAAVEQAGGADDVIVTMDADNTQPPELIPSMLEQIRAGSDLVIASRYRPGARVRGLSVPRRGLSLGASLLFRASLPIAGVRDYTCGFRAYRASLLRQAFDRFGADQLVAERGFSCMVDILLRLRSLKPVVSEVPLDLRYDYKRGASKMRVARTVGATLRVMLRHRVGALRSLGQHPSE